MTQLPAPVQGAVIAIEVEPGQRVVRGQVLVLLESMKMEVPLAAPGDGIVGACLRSFQTKWDCESSPSPSGRIAQICLSPYPVQK